MFSILNEDSCNGGWVNDTLLIKNGIKFFKSKLLEIDDHLLS